MIEIKNELEERLTFTDGIFGEKLLIIESKIEVESETRKLEIVFELSEDNKDKILNFLKNM